MATQKQKRAFKKSVENGGNVSKAMRDAGYSPATAKTPQKLTESKAWDELMEEYLPDDLLMKVHSEGLQANRVLSAKIVVLGGNKEATTQTDDFIEVPDHATRHKYLDTALKLKDKYPAEKHKHQVEGAMAVPGLVDLLHKYVTPGNTSHPQGDSEAEG